MSATLLSTRGKVRDLGANVTACVFNHAGTACAFALGDGSVHLAPAGGDDWTRVEVHDGAVLALTADTGPGGFLTGGDDGALMRLSAASGLQQLFSAGGKWIEHVASFADGRGGLIACTAGKQVHLLDESGTKLKSLAHPSTVTGVALDAKGKRVAASHYNGASVWFTASKSDNARVLEWKGSHTGVAMHPAAEAVVTSMQENSLHGWRLADGQHMRMSGYPAKTESMGFSRGGKWLASSGADSIVLWPFFGGGPMGKPPLELAQIEGILCTRVAFHPKDEVVAAGFADGTVVVADIGSRRVVVVAEPEGSAVGGLAWNAAGGALAFGTEAGRAAVLDLSARV